MKKSDNIKLNIIEGSDVPQFATFNENANIIDNAIGTITNHLNTINSSMEIIDTSNEENKTLISNLTNSVTENENNIISINDELTNLNNLITNVKDDFKKLSNDIIKIVENGVEKKYNKTIYKFEVENKNIQGSKLNEYLNTFKYDKEEAKKLLLMYEKYLVNLNLTNLLNISKEDIESNKYKFNGYGMTINPTYGGGFNNAFPKFTLDYVMYHPYLNYVVANYTSKDSSIIEFTDNLSYSPTKSEITKDAYFILEVYELIEE